MRSDSAKYCSSHLEFNISTVPGVPHRTITSGTLLAEGRGPLNWRSKDVWQFLHHHKLNAFLWTRTDQLLGYLVWGVGVCGNPSPPSHFRKCCIFELFMPFLFPGKPVLKSWSEKSVHCRFSTILGKKFPWTLFVIHSGILENLLTRHSNI